MVKIKGVTQKFSGNIEFEDLSQSDYQLLCSIVEQLNSGNIENEARRFVSDDKPDMVVENKGNEKEAVNGGSESISGISKNVCSGRPVEAVKSMESITKIVKGVLDEISKTHEQYEWRLANAGEFISEHPKELEGIGPTTLGRVSEKLGIERRQVIVNGNSRRMRIYPMKVKAQNGEELVDQKKEDEQDDQSDSGAISECIGWNFKQANYLKNRRKQVGLSIKEFSDLINYPFSVVQAWELGTKAPSEGAMKAIEKWYGAETVRELNNLAAKVAS